MRQKKPFLLLEILISILLISFCLIPLIQSPILSYRNELTLLEEMERERLAEWSFSEIKEKLLKNEIPWEKLPDAATTTAPIQLPPIWIEIPNCEPKKIERSFTLACTETGVKEGLKGEIYKKVKVEIFFSPRLGTNKKEKRHYRFKVVVQKLPPTTYSHLNDYKLQT